MSDAKSPDNIETVFRVAADGIPIESSENLHWSIPDARKFAATIPHNSETELTIQEITTIITTHDLNSDE